MNEVSVSTGMDLDDMTKRAVAYLGGIEDFISNGDKVFIKPNYVACARDPYDGVTVKPEIVKAVARLCLEGGARVGVGDYSHLKPVDFDILGIRELEDEGVRLLDLKDHDCCCAVPSTTDLQRLYVNKHVLDADKVISVSVLKTHSITCNTLCAKNLMGLTPVHLYGMGIKGTRAGIHRIGAINKVIVELVDAVKPCLNIVDCSIGIEGEGPGIGPGSWAVDVSERLGFWVVLAGANTFAVDLVGSAMMDQDPAQIAQYKIARDRGLIDSLDPFGVDLVGDETYLRNLVMSWMPPDCYPHPPLIPEESIDGGNNGDSAWKEME